MGAGENSFVISLPKKINTETRQLILRANEELTKHCPGLLKFAQHVVSAKAFLVEYPPGTLASHNRWKRFGWKMELHYQFRMNSKHLLRYVLGAGTKPGILAGTEPSKVFCGIDDGHAQPIHINVPKLKFLAGLKSG